MGKLLRWNDHEHAIALVCSEADASTYADRKINSDHPTFTDDFAVETFAKYYPEMLPCLDNGFDSLLDAATTELAIEEVALSQAIPGRYNDAINTASRLKESYRQNHVRFVIGIEQFRLGECEDFEAGSTDSSPIGVPLGTRGR